MAVDDEPAVLNVLKGMLEPLGCEVRMVIDSRVAAKRLTEEKVDGLIVDIRMPHMDGFELTKHVRNSKLNRQVPIIMLTGLDDAETMRKGFNLGASFFLGKPFTRDRLNKLFKTTKGPMLREMLRYLRLPYETEVDCTWGPKNTEKFRTSSVDISEEGISLSPSGRLAVGQELDLFFALPTSAQKMSLHARVVRQVPPAGIGLVFLKPSDHDRNAIQEYITARTQD